LVRNSDRDRGSGQAQCPFLQRIHRLVDYHIFPGFGGRTIKRESTAAAVRPPTGVCRLAFGAVLYCG
jgi:hypothetical protein